MDQIMVIGLRWGVKQSFRTYVQAVGGAVTTDSGALQLAEGEFVFDAALPTAIDFLDVPLPVGQVQFRGEVLFVAHGGMLSVRLTDPLLEIGATGARLMIDDGAQRVPLANLDLATTDLGAAAEIVIPATLTAEGSRVLGDHYPLGTALDPVRLLRG